MTMVERVARAIEPETFDLPRINLNKPAYDRAHGRAIAALKAMREPTEPMADDGYRAIANGADAVYRAMIDAAIAEAE